MFRRVFHVSFGVSYVPYLSPAPGGQGRLNDMCPLWRGSNLGCRAWRNPPLYRFPSLMLCVRCPLRMAGELLPSLSRCLAIRFWRRCVAEGPLDLGGLSRHGAHTLYPNRRVGGPAEGGA